MEPVRVVGELFKEYASLTHGELEAKLGRLETDHNGKSRFISGVSQDTFKHIHEMLRGYKGWEAGSSQEWVPSYDYFLDNNVRCSKSSAGHEFMRKTTVRHINLECPEREYDIRVSLKKETPTEIKSAGVPTLVRVKKRKSFLYKIWSFDLTMVWSGVNEQDAQQNDPTFEVEIECRDRREASRDTQYAAASLLEKMIDLLGRERSYSLVPR